MRFRIHLSLLAVAFPVPEIHLFQSNVKMYKVEMAVVPWIEASQPKEQRGKKVDVCYCYSATIRSMDV